MLPLVLLLAQVAPIAAATTAATATEIAAKIAGPGTVVTGASYVTTPSGAGKTPNGISDGPLAGFGSAAGFGILTNGDVKDVGNTAANLLNNTNNDLGGNTIAGRGNTAKDISILKIDLAVPQGANCLTFDFKFLSAEYPTFVGGNFNDAFIAELDTSTWTTNNSTISAPDNFAFDGTGQVVSINSTGIGGLATGQAAGTPYNVVGATGLLRASKQITAGAHSVYFSIFDQGDAIYSSAVFLNNLVVGFVPNPATDCVPGATLASYKLAMTPTSGSAAIGTQHSLTATLTDAAGAPLANADLDFTVAGANPATATITTDNDGKATFTYTGTNPGNDQIAVCYQPENAVACGALASAQFDWTSVPTGLSVNAATGYVAGSVNLTATLIETGVAPLAGQVVTFTLNGAAVCGGGGQPSCPTTDAAGVAILNGASLAGIAAGNYPTGVGAQFALTSPYAASTATAALTVLLNPQTISFGPLPDRTLGDADFDITVTASSKLAVALSATGPCTLSGVTIHLTGVGTCTLTANQLGDTVYEPALPVAGAFRIVAPAGAPVVGVAPVSLAFDTRQVNTTSDSQQVILTNSGGSPLAITGVTLGGANGGDFAITFNTCVGQIPAGASCVVGVRFSPTATGQRGATLTIADSATGSPRTVTLGGSATPPPVTPAQQAIVTASANGQGQVSPAGATSYDIGSQATYAAVAEAGQVFLGWTLDGRYVGYASPLTFTVGGNRTLVATFAARPTFADVPSNDPDYRAITTLAALGIINPAGVNGSGNFEPGREVKRAEVAAFIARLFGWEAEFHGNSFPDKCDPQGQGCIDDQLWNAVAALKDYGVVGGYTDPATCQAAGTTAPCYLPREGVLRLQVVSIVARAFTTAPDLRPTGFWDRLPADPALYTNVPDAGTQRSDLATYRANAGAIPGQAGDAQFPSPNESATRRFVIQVLWQAYNAQFGTDRVP